MRAFTPGRVACFAGAFLLENPVITQEQREQRRRALAEAATAWAEADKAFYEADKAWSEARKAFYEADTALAEAGKAWAEADKEETL